MPDTVAWTGRTSIQALKQSISSRKRVAFVSGNFNIIHPGHLRLLTFARESADVLVVGVNAGPDRAITVPAPLRLEGVKSLAMVDHAILLDGGVEEAIQLLQPNVVVKGKEYESHSNVEEAIVESYGGRLLFGSGEVRFSSMDLIQREYFGTDFSAIRKPLDFLKRNGVSPAQLQQTLRKFPGMRVVVVGDVILDNYITCDPIGMSQEDPTIVVTPIEETTFVGGAGIVAAHARGLGADVKFVSVAGEDDSADFARKALQEHGVQAELLVDRSRPTTLKRRFRANGKTLLRVNVLRQHPIEPDIAKVLVARAKAALDHADVLLFSDFNYGCLPQSVVDALTEAATKRGVMMAADSQASSQLADIARFKGMNLITPTEREARLALRDFKSGLVVVAERVQELARAKSVFITLGGEGLLTYADEAGEFRTDRLPAFNSAPKDVAGAGDSLFITATMALHSGASPWEAAYLGAMAAACQVSRVGNLPLSRDDLFAEI